MNSDQLSKQRASVRIGGKGTPRRKVKKVVKNRSADDSKLNGTLKKLGVQGLDGIEEVNMFREDGNVVHFNAPRVGMAYQNHTLVINGKGDVKELTELVPGILNQLGPDSLESLRKLAESYQAIHPGALAAAAKAAASKDDDNDVPDLVENL
ncbi:nascent polypeptide-associated complex subunit beta [Syncephalis pseudoplumigaleata]|uniref:Nascent polypeptide-associated complex subunit beta n=1 Tax=Syncephalis pseudoplumigaleata TaxID=1712513 RepID=A0A4P9Z4T3_9FUNG|nr:nascent polypeptide-associated complex subunit beta [Syncephalis pseudoplumigaleata]|eukprot:RKP27604.1 nascent polypeptide-associated complex subunit beta [Syncephalis pseudoplumigaleata]